MKKIIIIGLILMLVTGCQADRQPADKTDDTDPIVEETEEEDNHVDENNESDNNQDQEVISEFNTFIGQDDLTAIEIGEFIKVNIDSLETNESEEIIELLIWHQQDLINNMNTKIYQENYMKALNQTMGGILDAEKVQDIEDEDVQRDYQNLVSSYLKVVRYEETPVVETDWERLKQLNENFSSDFSQMVTLWDKIQNYRYDRRNPELKVIAEDAVKVEEIIKNNEVSFLTWQSEILYNKLVSNVLVGPEGSYIGLFIDKNDEMYDKLIEFTKEYPNSKLAQLIIKLDEGNFEDFQEITEIIRNFNLFGIKSNKELMKSRIEEKETLENISYIKIPNDFELQVKINDLINQKAETLVEYEVPNVRNHFFYGNEKYASMILSASYSTEESEFNYIDQYVVINLETGEEETLDDLFGQPFKAYKDDLEDIYDIVISERPDYSIESNGLVLIFQNQKGIENYKLMPINQLNKLVSFEIFYK